MDSAVQLDDESIPATNAPPKRTRPTPSKTFQCRGHGDCRMVFSRSEHLARHIRKHTGERPFSCHCGKQFSRLDNLRQHAQTVHADKPEMNERMMRELGRVHATMVAANKQAASGSSGRTRGSQDSTAAGGSATSGGGRNPGRSKARPGTSTGYEGAGGGEDMYPGLSMAPNHQLSLTGFSDLPDPYLIPKKEKSNDDLASLALDGENGNGNGSYSRSENTSNGSYSKYSNVRYQDPRRYDMDVDAEMTSSSRRQSFRGHPDNRDTTEYAHSFRSFRDRQQQRPSTTSYPAHPQHSRSFSGSAGGPFRFNVPEGDSNGYSNEREPERPSTATTARPGTSTRPSTGTTLPPLASIVPSSVAPLPPPPPSLARPGSNAGHGRPISSAGLGGSHGYGNSLPPFGSSSGGFPTLPALSGSANSSGLRLPPPNPSGFDHRPGSRGGSSQGLGLWPYRPGTAPTLGPGAAAANSKYTLSSGPGMGVGWEDDRSSFGDSPFSFNAPPLSSSSSGNRKRGFSAVDEGDDDEGGESRPQSRKLSIMELCESGDAGGRGGILFTAVGNMERDRDVHSSAGTGSRPGTNGTSFIVRGAAGLDLGDRDNGSRRNSRSLELLKCPPYPAGGAATKSKGENPGPPTFYTANSNSSSSSAESTSSGPPTTSPSPLSAYATRPSTSGSYRSSRSPRSPVESDHGHGYANHGRHAGYDYGQYGSGGYGSSNASYARNSSHAGRHAGGGSPSSNVSTSPALTSRRSPLSAQSPSTPAGAEVHPWR